MTIHDINRRLISIEEEEIFERLYKLSHGSMFEEMRDECIKAIDRFPDQFHFYSFLSTSFIELNDIESAKKVLNNMHDKFGSRHEIYFHKSRIDQLEGDEKAEVESLLEAIKLVPEDYIDVKSDYLADLGEIFIDTDEAKAIQYLEAALETNPLNRYARQLLSELLADDESELEKDEEDEDIELDKDEEDDDVELDDDEEDDDVELDDDEEDDDVELDDDEEDDDVELDDDEEDDDVELDDDEEDEMDEKSKAEFKKFESDNVALFTDIQKKLYFKRTGKSEFDSVDQESDFLLASEDAWSDLFYRNPQEVLDASPEELNEIYSALEVNPEDVDEEDEGLEDSIFPDEAAVALFDEAFSFLPPGGIKHVMFAYPVLVLEKIDAKKMAEFVTGNVKPSEQEANIIKLAFDAGVILEEMNQDKSEQEVRILLNQLFEKLVSQVGERKAGMLMDEFMSMGEEDDYTP
ncbi:MAG: hypothetical protein IPL67_11225 [Ignavibacteria bacterium]|nr:hypothetical protein [Ignavibacteria bacterium]